MKTLTVLALIAASPIEAAAGMRLGIVAPDSGTFERLGNNVREGTMVFVGENANAFDDVVEAPEECTVESGADAATSMAEAGVDAVIGFLCTESLSGALPILSENGIPALTVSVRSDILMEDAEKKGWPFFRLAPSGNSEAARITDIIATEWNGEPFALIEDGTIYGRELAESIRIALEERGIKPAFLDNFRPAQEKQFGIARRLKKAGVTHVFIGGDRNDVATITRDSRAFGLDLTIMGGDALNAAEGPVPLPDGVLAVITPSAQSRFSATEAILSLQLRGYQPEGYRIPAYAGAQVLSTAYQQAVASGIPLAKSLIDGTFSTALGPIQFTDKRELAENPFQLVVWQGSRFVPVGEAAEVQSQ